MSELSYYYDSVIVQSFQYGYGAWCHTTETNVVKLEIINKRVRRLINNQVSEVRHALDKKLLDKPALSLKFIPLANSA